MDDLETKSFKELMKISREMGIVFRKKIITREYIIYIIRNPGPVSVRSHSGCNCNDKPCQ